MIRRFRAILISLLISLLPIEGNANVDETSGTPTTFFVLVDKSGSMDDAFPAPIQSRLSDTTKLQDVRRRLGLLAEHLPSGTRVIVIAFDHEAEQIYSGVLDSDEQRLKLRQAFEGIRSRNGSTFLWRTLDENLAKAKRLIEENKDSRVRVLLYTDGVDEERRPNLDHSGIVTKYAEYLQSSVKLDWITIGFDVKGPVREQLLKAGVRITKADKPEDLDPIFARFSLSKQELLVGDDLRLEDKSIGNSITERIVDWGDGTPLSKLSDGTSHRYTSPSEYIVRLAIRNRSGQLDRCSQTVRVMLPELCPARIEIGTTEYQTGHYLESRDATASNFQSRSWMLGDHIISSDNSIRILLNQVGQFDLRLVRIDEYGRTTEDRKKISVNAPPRPVATFRLASSVSGPGEPVVFLNESSPSIDRSEWKVNGKVVSSARHLEWVPESPGTAHVQLTVWDRDNQSQTAERAITVPAPPGPQLAIIAPDKVAPGTMVNCAIISTGEFKGSPSWSLHNQPLGTGDTIAFEAPKPGEYIVAVELNVSGRVASTQHKLLVLPFDPPQAAFTVGTERPFVGDTIRITDISRGRTDKIDFQVLPSAGQPLTRTFEAATLARSFNVTCQSVGPLTIRQHVHGPGGESTDEQTIEVVARATPPSADFQVQKVAGQTKATLTFISRCLGSIDRLEFDPGDGSPSQELLPEDVIQHTYLHAGTYNARIVAHSNVSGFSPSVWTSPAIRIPHELPVWIKRLWWQLPIALALMTMSWLLIGRFRRWQIDNELRRLNGVLNIQPIGKPLGQRTFQLTGSSEELVALDPKSSLRLTCEAHEPSSLRAELLIDGNSQATAKLDENGQARIGGYEISYVAIT